MDLQNVNVKFTQDDTYYIFHVTGNGSTNIFRDVDKAPYTGNPSGVVPLLYKKANFGNGMYIYEADKMPFSSFNTGTLYMESAVKILGTTIEDNRYSYRLHLNGSITEQDNRRDGNGDKYFIGNRLRFFGETNAPNFNSGTSYPFFVANDGLGVKLLSNSSYHYYTYNSTLRDGYNCVDMYYTYINAKIAIEKQYMDDYRYVCFAQSYPVKTSRTIESTRERQVGASLCSQTIDLKTYAHCEHDWQMRTDDRTSHSVYCKNCEWTKTEPHSLLYEYDGIKHNVCTCSYIEKVKYYFNINDDYTDEVVEEFESDADYKKVEFQNKTGYKFRHYNVYEKQFVSTENLSTNSNALKIVLVATSSNLPERTGQVSRIYEAQYDANKFKILYSNTNNKNLSIKETIEPQLITYDEEAFLKEHIACEGYVFDGWSTTKGGETIDLKPKQEVTNYSDKDLFELTLYPVYNNLVFNVAYTTGRGHFNNGSNYKVVQYTYFDKEEFETVETGNPELFVFGYFDDFGNRFFSLSEVKKFLDKKGVNNVTINLFPMFKRTEYSVPSRSAEGNGPGDDDKKKKIENDLNDQDSEIQNDELLIPKDDIIYGMSDTKGNKDEEPRGAIKATLSFIRKKPGNEKSMSKLDRLLLFIRNNLILCSVAAVLLIILLIIYEILVIRYYRKLNQQMIN